MISIKKQNHTHPQVRPVLILFSCLILLMLITVLASYSNTKKYYVAEKDGALEIWQGRFAPLTKKQLLTLPGVQLAKPHKPVYNRNEVYLLAYQYYIQKADTILEVPGIPDFDGIKSYMNKAMSFAVTDEQFKTALSRLNGIDIMILLYKSDVSAGKGSLSDLKTALSYLEQARSKDIDGQHTHILLQKMEVITSLIKAKQ